MSKESTEKDTLAWWIARPENTNTIWYTLVFICVALIVGDFVYHSFMHEKHGYFSFETAIGFHAAYGFGAFIFVVLLGKELRKLIMRPEGYYDVPVEKAHHDDHDVHHTEEPQTEDLQGGDHHA